MTSLHSSTVRGQHEATRPATDGGSARPPAGQRLQPVAAALALLLGVGAVPLALVMLTAPLIPSSLPTSGQIADLLTTRDSGQLLIGALLAVAWAGWLSFAASVAVEGTAQVRGRAAPRLRAAGPAQALAARLVAVVALSMSGSSLALLPAALPQPAAAAAVRLDLPPATTTAASVPAGTDTVGHPPDDAPRHDRSLGATGRPSPSHKLYQVAPARAGHRDSLWSIAEQHLGDPLRWHEIFALNRDRPQTDGHALTDPHWIRPGWQLRMPPDATGLPPRTDPDTDPDTDTGRASMPARSEVQGRTSPAASTGPRQVAAAVPTQPGLSSTAAAAQPESRPVTGRQIIDTPAPAATAPRTAATPASAQNRPTAKVTSAPTPTVDAGHDAPSRELLLIGGGLLAAGVLSALTRLRTLQRRRRPDGHRLPRPAPDLLTSEVRLRVLAENDDREFLDAALRSLPVVFGSAPPTSAPLPDVAAARLHRRGLELILAAGVATDPPAPFTASADGHRWQLDRTVALPVPVGRTGGRLSPLPALVPVGHDEAGTVLLDLERLGTVSVTGPPAAVQELFARIAAEYAVSSCADAIQVTLVGFGSDLCALAPDRLRHLETLTEPLLRELEHRATDVAAARRADHPDPVLASRCGTGSDPCTPEIVLCAGEPDPPTAQRLAQLADERGRTGIAVIVAGSWPAARWHLTLRDDGRVDLPALDLQLTANHLDAHAAATLTNLMRTAQSSVSTVAPASAAPEDTSSNIADHPTSATPPPAPTEQRDPSSPAADIVAAAANDAGAQATAHTKFVPTVWSVHEPATRPEPADELDLAIAAFLTDEQVPAVSVLGAVQVRGPGPVENKRIALCTEIVVYLATHGRTVADLSRFDAAIWPDRTVQPSTRTEALTRARRWLGTDPTGSRHLPQGYRERLTLGPGVLLDWELFERLVQRDRPGDLLTALRLVRGRPFEAVPPGRYSWLSELYLEQDIPAAVIDTAHSLARSCFHTGEFDTAREAARIAQLVDPYDERPWRDRLQAEHALGNHGAVRRLVADLRATLEDDLDDVLTDQTAELIERLLPSSRTGTG